MATEDDSTDTPQQRALAVLRMVGELHEMGYQRLRIEPAMSASGMYWRCSVSHAGNIRRSHGATLRDYDRDVAHYSTGEMGEYFGWTDAQDDSPRALAEKFLDRFPEIARLGQGADQPYADWFKQMLELADRGAFPIAYADYSDDSDPTRLPTTGGDADADLPMPPGGEAEGRE